MTPREILALSAFAVGGVLICAGVAVAAGLAGALVAAGALVLIFGVLVGVGS